MKDKLDKLYDIMQEIEDLDLDCPPLYYDNVENYKNDLLDNDILDCINTLQDFFCNISSRILDLFNNAEWFSVDRLDEYNIYRFTFINNDNNNYFNIDLTYDTLKLMKI